MAKFNEYMAMVDEYISNLKSAQVWFIKLQKRVLKETLKK